MLTDLQAQIEEMHNEEHNTTLIVECECGAVEEFQEGSKPELFPETPDGQYSCPFCEEWSPEAPEGYTRPVFKPANKETLGWLK